MTTAYQAVIIAYTTRNEAPTYELGPLFPTRRAARRWLDDKGKCACTSYIKKAATHAGGNDGL